MRRWKLPNGQVLAQINKDTFVCLDEANSIVNTHLPRAYAYEYDFYEWQFFVKENQFIEYMVIKGFDNERTKSRVVFDELHELDVMESPTLGEIHDAIATQKEHKAIAKLTASAMIDALAQVPINVPSLNIRQRRRLANRVMQYDDKLSKAMLELLTTLADFYLLIEGAALQEIDRLVELLDIASAFLTFDPQRSDSSVPLLSVDVESTPRKPDEPILYVLIEPRQRLTELLPQRGNSRFQKALLSISKMEDLTRKLVFAADVQSYVDAQQNAICYLKASKVIQVASRHLAAACQSVLRGFILPN